MSLAQQLPTPSLYEQLCALPDNLVGEILDHTLHTQPRPTGRHGLAGRGLSVNLAGPYDLGRGGPGGWWIIAEPEVHFVRDIEIAVPDLAGWRREQMPGIPDGHRFEVVPDWVCEILSPGTAKKDRTLKLPLYARHGIPHCWLVDPVERTLEAYELRQGFWTLLATLKDDDPVSLPPFDAISFALAELWA